MHQLGVTFGGLDLIGMHAVEEGAGGIGAIGILIAERRAIVFGVPALAGDHTGMAAHAGVQVNDQTHLAVGGVGELGHLPTFHFSSFGPVPTGESCAGTAGWLSCMSSGAAAFSILTLRSNHAA